MSKGLAYYDATQDSVIMVGKSAIVFPIKHHDPSVSCEKFVVTSPVISYDDVTGIFETANTRYEPRRAS